MTETQLTRSAYLWTKGLTAPFWAIYALLPFILQKDLGASLFQVTLIVTLKPLVSIFSIYWSQAIARRPHTLVRSIIFAGVLSHVPFLFCPYIDNPWFFITIFGMYMMLARGVMPAWMEILKLNIPPVSREKVFAYGSIIGHLCNLLFPVAFGVFLDGYTEAWRFIFPFAALLSFVSIIFQLRIPLSLKEKVVPKESLKEHLIKPWAKAWQLLKERVDFRYYQVGFMLGGAGLMVIHPVLPMFFTDTLSLSYTEMTIALSLFKGVGYVMTTPTWARWMNKVDLFRFNSLVTLFAALFPILLVVAQVHLIWLYMAYMSYGVMQAGSDLSWNLSGPIFARDKDSYSYTDVNILAVGVRGAIFPALGSLLCAGTQPLVVIAFGCLLSLFATERMLSYARRESVVKSI